MGKASRNMFAELSSKHIEIVYQALFNRLTSIHHSRPGGGVTVDYPRPELELINRK